jgi:hypothetical protein
LTCHGLNLNSGYFGCFTPICSCGKSRLHVPWCVGDRCDIADSDEDLAGVGDLLQRTGDGQAHIVYSVAERSEGRVMSYAIYTVHNETRSVGFLVEPQNQGW